MPGAGLQRTRSRDGALEEAFDAAFRALDPGHARRSAATWSWRTEQVPSGAPFVTLRSQEGAVLAHYGALAQGLLVDGQRLLAGQAVDTFAAAELPRRRRAAVFQEACEAFIEDHCGVGPCGGVPASPVLPAAEVEGERFAFCYGFPVRPAWRLGRAGLGYGLVQEFLQLTRPVGAQGTARWDLDLAVDAAWPSDLDELFRREAPPVAFERTVEWLRWRFDADPSAPSTRVLLTRGGELAAWAVLRERKEGAASVGVVVDRFVPERDDDAADALESALDECARAQGWAALALALGEADPDLVRLQQRGWRAELGAYALVGRSFDPRAPQDRLSRELRWTLADTDLA